MPAGASTFGSVPELITIVLVTSGRASRVSVAAFLSTSRSSALTPACSTIATVRSAGSRGRASLATSSPPTVTAKSSAASGVPDWDTGGAAITRYAPSGCSRSPPMRTTSERTLCPPTGAAPARSATSARHGREHSRHGACRPSPNRRGRRPPVEPRHVAPPQGAVPVMVWTAMFAGPHAACSIGGDLASLRGGHELPRSGGSTGPRARTGSPSAVFAPKRSVTGATYKWSVRAIAVRTRRTYG